MKSEYFLLFLLILSFLCSCEIADKENKYSAEATNIIHITPNDTEELNISDLVSDFYFLKLKTPDGIHFATPDKVMIIEDRIYIMDIYRALKLLVFDIHGEFIFEISNYGRGPGEFISPNDFVVDSENGQIAIFDQGNVKVSFYDIEDGTFIKDHNLDFWSYTFAKNHDGFVFFNNNLQRERNSYNVAFTDHELNVVKRDIKISPDQKNFHHILPRNFYSYNNDLYLNIPYDNIIYSINGNQVLPHTKVDFGELNLPDSFFRTYTENRERIRESNRYAHNVSNYFESDNYLFFRYSYNSNNNYYFYSKETNSAHHTGSEQLYFDFDLGPMTAWPIEIVQDYLVWHQQSFSLINYIDGISDELTDDEWAEFKSKNQKLLEFYKSINSHDNPYLIFTKLDF